MAARCEACGTVFYDQQSNVILTCPVCRHRGQLGRLERLGTPMQLPTSPNELTLPNILDAVLDAKEVLAKADRTAEAMAQLLIGRVHHCADSTVVALKRELASFSIKTGTWKD